MYTDARARVLVAIDTDQIPKILRQPERTCPRTETPVAQHDVALRNIRGLRAFDAPRDSTTLIGRELDISRGDGRAEERARSVCHRPPSTIFLSLG